MKETNTTNPELIKLISLLKKESREKQAGIWLDIAEYLSKTRSQRVSVNLSTVNRNTKRSDVVVIPGKLLGSGSIDHAITVARLALPRKQKISLLLPKQNIFQFLSSWRRILRAQT